MYKVGMDLLSKDWDRTPYVYVIGWQWLGLYYIGSHTRKGCHPDNLIVQYRTSSKRVHAILDKHGLPDIVWYRIVNTVTDALQLESFLQLISNAKDNPRYLNEAVFFNGKVNCAANSPNVRAAIKRNHARPNLGRKQTNEEKRKRGNSVREWHKHNTRVMSAEQRKARSELMKAKWSDDEYRKSQTKAQSEGNSYFKAGDVPWNKGKSTPESTKLKLSKANRGRKLSMQSRINQRKGRERARIQQEKSNA